MTIAILCLTPVSIIRHMQKLGKPLATAHESASSHRVATGKPGDLLYVSLPIGTGIGILAYWLSGFLVKRNPDHNSAKKS